MNDTKYIAEQLSQLRDLLIVIERGGDKSPDVLYKLAIEKSQKITSLVEQWRNDAAPAQVELPEEYALWLDGCTEEEAAEDAQPEELPAEDEVSHSIDFALEPMPEQPQEEEPFVEAENEVESEDADDVDEDDDEYIAPFVEDSYEVSPTPPSEVVVEIEHPTIVVEDEPATIEVEQPEQPFAQEDNVADDFIEISESEPVEVEEFVEDRAVDFFVDEVVDEVDSDYGFVPDDDEAEEDDPVDVEPQDYAEDDEEQDLYNRGEPFDVETPVTVGEMMSVRQAKELRKALSLNDRFRFRRELFGNSDINMNNTLNLLDTMNDLAEAREYLLQDLGWSTDEPVVQEFLSLVERHFKQ